MNLQNFGFRMSRGAESNNIMPRGWQPLSFVFLVLVGFFRGSSRHMHKDFLVLFWDHKMKVVITTYRPFIYIHVIAVPLFLKLLYA